MGKIEGYEQRALGAAYTGDEALATEVGNSLATEMGENPINLLSAPVKKADTYDFKMR